eukprot:1931948-Pleurochrysis_carterae.AAC.1
MREERDRHAATRPSRGGQGGEQPGSLGKGARDAVNTLIEGECRREVEGRERRSPKTEKKQEERWGKHRSEG